MKQVLLVCVLGGHILSAADPIEERKTAASAHGEYVTVNLSGVANSVRPVEFPSARIKVNRIPFDVLKDARADHLFLKPIGWAGATDETREYPGYIANYDKAGVSDWNSNDARGRSYINHEGWRCVRFPLPGQYGRNSTGYHWPYTSQWRHSGDGVVRYPLTFTKRVVTIPEKMLYLDRYEPVQTPEIGLSDLHVTYVPAEELWQR